LLCTSCCCYRSGNGWTAVCDLYALPVHKCLQRLRLSCTSCLKGMGMCLRCTWCWIGEQGTGIDPLPSAFFICLLAELCGLACRLLPAAFSTLLHLPSALPGPLACVPTSRASKKSKGFALVQFADPQDAVKAHAGESEANLVDALDGCLLSCLLCRLFSCTLVTLSLPLPSLPFTFSPT
jgi:hypothetical protein